MNQLPKRRISRVLSHILILTLLAPTWLVLLAVPATAQTTTLAVGVVDFRNESGIQGEMLSRLATDAVALELAKQPSFDVFPRTQVTQEMKRLGITPPLNKISLSKLGEALVADAMVDGSIRDVQIRGTGGSRRAAVTLIVEMLDQASGEAINGAVQTGYSNPRVGYTGDDDTLITEAIDNAAFLAVKTMSEYIIPEATVQNSIGEDSVLLNKGSRDGIKRGMRMIVKRDKEIIGYLAVSSVSPNDAVAKVVRAMRGVKAEDKATAIFDMPVVSGVRTDVSNAGLGAPPAKKGGHKLTSVKNILIALLAIGGLVALINSGGNGSEDPGAASVRSTTSGALLTWNSGALWGGKNVDEAHIWRDDVQTPIIAAPWQNGSATDTFQPVTTTYTAADPADPTTTTSLQTTVPAGVYGQTYTYSISALYHINSNSGGTAAVKYYESEKRTAGRMTLIEPMVAGNLLEPEVGAPIDPQDPTFAFQWKAVKGADRYLIQVSSTPNFPNTGQTWQNISHPVISDPNAVAGTITWNAEDSLRSYLAGISASSTQDQITVYWRVGVANSTDTAFKGQVTNFVFSPASSFNLLKMPPLPG